MSLTGVSLKATSSTGPGETMTPDTPMTRASMQISTTGAPAGVVVDLEGTIDGINFVKMGEYNGDGTGGVVISGNGGVAIAPFVAVRANLVLLSGGTSPTVTAAIAVA